MCKLAKIKIESQNQFSERNQAYVEMESSKANQTR